MDGRREKVMFTAVIIACHIADLKMCMMVNDTRSPYRTEAECIERLDEMKDSLYKVWSMSQMPFRITSRICVKADKKESV